MWSAAALASAALMAPITRPSGPPPIIGPCEETRPQSGVKVNPERKSIQGHHDLAWGETLRFNPSRWLMGSEH